MAPGTRKTASWGAAAMAAGTPTVASLYSAPPMMAGVPEDDPRCAGWLVPNENCTMEGYELVLRGECDEGIWETPWGSNRGGRIDKMTLRAKYELKQSWCGIWLGAVYQDRGMYVPQYYGAVDWWLPYAVPMTFEQLTAIVVKGGEGLKLLPGAAIIYGKRGTLALQSESGQGYHPDVLKKNGWDGVHIGMITRAETNAGAPGGVAILTREANRGYGMVTNNGVVCDEAPLVRHDVIAIYYPRRAPNYVAKKQTIRLVPA